MSEISIALPVYEFKGDGVKYIDELFASLAKQSFTDFDVVISDHSKDDVIMEYLRDCEYDFDITYVKNPNGRGFQAPNTDCAIEHAEGRIIKLIYQDDLFVDNDALQKIYDAIENGAKWLIHGFTHTTDGVETHRDCAPKWSSRMLEGDNLLGSPSCTAYLNGTYLGMDHEMKLLIDTELYHRMRMEHGMPVMLDDVLIANREHENRTSASGIAYDKVLQCEDGRSWLVNSEELDRIYRIHNRFLVTREYPDEKN